MKSLVPYLIVAVLAWIAGTLTCQPRESEETRVLRDSLQNTRETFDSTVKALGGSYSLARVEADSLAALSAQASQRGNSADRWAIEERSRGDALARAVAEARTAADSLPALVREVASLKGQRDSLRFVADNAKESLHDAQGAFARLSQGADSLHRANQAQAARIVALENLAERTREPAPCRIPLIGLGCPGLGVDYNASTGGVLAGVDVPVTKWARVGVRWDIARR